jgi:carbamoyl-phosphate synthase large subunit
LGRFPKIRDQVTAIAEVLKPSGPCNMQFRVTPEGAFCLEINVRFSGTTPMRARLGFNEVESALRQFVLGEEPRDLPQITEGVVFRYWNELYGEDAGFEHLAEAGSLEQPRTDQAFLEDWGFSKP